MPHAPLPSIQVQVVLYRTPLEVIWRLLSSVGAAARHVVGSGRAGRVELAFGDCSPSPSLTDLDVRALQEAATGQGLADLRYTFFDANLGSAGGSNRLGLGARTDFVLVLNPDTYPAPSMLSELLSVAQDPTVGIADARQLPLEHPKDFDLRTGDTSWASGACSFMRTEVFERVRGYDTDNFFLYCDDVDLSWRVRLAGLRVVHVPRAIAVHDKRINLDGNVLPTATEHYYGVLGRLMLARKFNDPEVLASTLEWVEAHGTQSHKDAVVEYRRREAEGRLPGALPGGERAARFVNGEYAPHRW